MLGKTYVYTYDNGGNRTSKVTYAYTTGTLGAATATESYTYGNASWRDQLTAFNGTAITYDAIGNPTTFNGYTLSWHGRQLKKMTKSGSTIEFLYNADGIRTSKKVNNVEHIYTLNGTQIVSESWGNNLLIYLYDESGSPIGMQYRNSSYAAHTFDTFYFEKNLQGDIISVYSAGGTKILSYTYDAWGNHTTTWHNSSGTNINATYNPFRYRGYYYDTETGLYYLQSRYYNPACGRFLNADAYVNANGDLVGFNMYVYCSNDPVMGYDPTGKWTISLGISGYIVFIGGISYSYNLVFDDKGNIAFQMTEANILKKQSGTMLGFLGAGISTNVGFSNASSVYGLEGISYSADISAGSWGIEAFTSDIADIENSVAGVSISNGASVELTPGAPHATASDTTPIFAFNIVEVAKNVWEEIVSWFS